MAAMYFGQMLPAPGEPTNTPQSTNDACSKDSAASKTPPGRCNHRATPDQSEQPKPAQKAQQPGATAEQSKEVRQNMTQSPHEPEYIGVGYMQNDGTIVLRLTRNVDGVIYHDELEYAPLNPAYPSVLQHIMPIKPGQTVSVKPWPEKEVTAP